MNPIKFRYVLIKKRIIKRVGVKLGLSLTYNKEYQAAYNNWLWASYKVAHIGARIEILTTFMKWFDRNTSDPIKYEESLSNYPLAWIRIFRDLGMYEMARHIEEEYA